MGIGVTKQVRRGVEEPSLNPKPLTVEQAEKGAEKKPSVSRLLQAGSAFPLRRQLDAQLLGSAAGVPLRLDLRVPLKDFGLRV